MSTHTTKTNRSCKAEFHLIAPFARSVKLVADFTEWESFPLELINTEGGVWYTAVPLPPGHYCYHLIIDYQWGNSPGPARSARTRRFATIKSELEVI